MPNLPNIKSGNITLDIKNLDVVDLAADNISCKTFSINGEPIDQVFETVDLKVLNRNLTQCDANGDGLPSTNPNAGYPRFQVWGESEFDSNMHLVHKQNPSDVFNSYGVVLEMSNPTALPTYSSFGTYAPARTTTQIGHDYSSLNSSIYQSYVYYGDGDYRNALLIDSNSQLGSSTSSLCIKQPPTNLEVTLNVLGNSIQQTGTTGTINNVNYFANGAVPDIGMTLTISALPTSLNVVNAFVTGVTPKAGASGAVITCCDITYAVPAGSAVANSTKVYSVRCGPRLSSSGTTVTATWCNGPHAIVGQNIEVVATPSSFSTPTGGSPVTSTVVGDFTSTLTYTSSTSFTGNATAITSVKLVPGNIYTSANPLGNQGYVGIHTSIPRAPLDVLGNVIFRDRANELPLLKTMSEGLTEAQVVLYNTQTVDNLDMVVFDTANSLVSFKDATAPSATRTFFSIDCKNNRVDCGKANTFFRLDASNSRCGIGQTAVTQLATLGGFACSTLATFFGGNVQIQSPAAPTALQANNLVIGEAGTLNLFRTDVFNKRVSIGVTNALYELHVLGEVFRSTPVMMALNVNVGTLQVPSATPTAVKFGAKDAALDNSTTGTGGAGDPLKSDKLGLTHELTKNRFVYATTGVHTRKTFNVSATIGLAFNSTGYRQLQLNIYSSVSSDVVTKTLAISSNNAVNGVYWSALNQVFSLGNGECFDISIWQNSGSTLTIYSSSPGLSSIQIIHA